MLEDALAAANQIFTPPFRAVLWKTLALTLALLGLVWIALHKLLVAGIALPHAWAVSWANSWVFSWAAAALSLIGGLGLVAGLAFLVTPVSFIVAGYFFDELAEAVELELAPGEAPGRALALRDSLWLSVKFAAVALVVNALALLLLLVPGINAAAFSNSRRRGICPSRRSDGCAKPTSFACSARALSWRPSLPFPS